MLEARARVVEADAAIERHQAIGRQPVAAVADLQQQLVAVAQRVRPRSEPGRACGAMPWRIGVFDQRLQQQVRHLRVERFRLDVHLDAQTAAEPRLLDLQVLLQHVELFLERHFLDVRRVQRHPQQIAEAVDHLIGRVRRSVRISPEIVFSVLNRKCGCSWRCSACSCASTSRVSSCAAVERARLRLTPVRQRVREADEEQVRHQQPIELREVVQQRERPPARKVGSGRLVPHQKRAHGHHDRRVHDRVGQRRRKMKRDLARPVLAVEADAAARTP